MVQPRQDLARGAGTEMRVALGTAVLWSMVGVTFVGVLFTPVFCVAVRWFTDRGAPQPATPSTPPA